MESVTNQKISEIGLSLYCYKRSLSGLGQSWHNLEFSRPSSYVPNGRSFPWVPFGIFAPPSFLPRCREKIREVMKHFALEIRGEWYKIDLAFAKSRLDEALESYNNGEWASV